MLQTVMKDSQLPDIWTEHTRKGALVQAMVDSAPKYAVFLSTLSSFCRMARTFSLKEFSQAYSFSTLMPFRISFMSLIRESLCCICSTWETGKGVQRRGVQRRGQGDDLYLSINRLETNWTHKESRPRWLLWSANPMNNVKLSTYAWIKLCQNISEFKCKQNTMIQPCTLFSTKGKAAVWVQNHISNPF